MIVKSRGIILRSLKYGETSLILDIYSEGYGLNSYIVGGVRNKKTKTSAGSLQIMSIVDFVAYHKNIKTLYRIKEINTAVPYARIPFEIMRSSVGTFMVEMLKNILKENEENPELFEFIYDWFTYLDSTSYSVNNLHILFMLQLAEKIGVQPRDNYSVNNSIFDLKEGQFVKTAPNHSLHLDSLSSEILYDFMMEEKETVHELTCNNAIRRILLDKLIRFYQLHVDSVKEVHSHLILNEILS